MFNELWGGTCSLHLEAPFSPVWELRGRHFQAQRVPGSGCGIQGRPLHLGKSLFKSRGRLDGAQGSEGGISSRSQGDLSL